MVTRIALIFPIVLAGCSLFKTDVSECKTSTVCRQAFGPGYACNTSGLCEEVELAERCKTRDTYPTDLLTDETDKYADTIIFGNLMDETVETHQNREDAARLAYKRARDEGGDFAVIFCTIEENAELDALARADAAVAMARHLAEIGVSGIVGPAASGDTQKVFQAFEDDGTEMLIISPSATSPALTALDPAPGLLWRTAAPDDLQAQAIVQDMTDFEKCTSHMTTTVPAIPPSPWWAPESGMRSSLSPHRPPRLKTSS
jgi:hypothetical protein